jgi:hypothetical protein
MNEFHFIKGINNKILNNDKLWYNDDNK